jgi:hypothetical protein
MRGEGRCPNSTSMCRRVCNPSTSGPYRNNSFFFDGGISFDVALELLPFHLCVCSAVGHEEFGCWVAGVFATCLLICETYCSNWEGWTWRRVHAWWRGRGMCLARKQTKMKDDFNMCSTVSPIISKYERTCFENQNIWPCRCTPSVFSRLAT